MNEIKKTKNISVVIQKSAVSTIDRLINWANFTAIIIVGLATTMLILVIAKAMWTSADNQAPIQINVNYTLKVDSNQLRNYRDSSNIEFDKFITQNNQKVIKAVDSSVNLQYKRMESILSVQEDKSKLFTYGAGFLAILVALATFFGFKSINEMKKATIDVAEYEATKVAEVKAKEVAQKEAKSEIIIQFQQIQNDLESTLKILLLDTNKKEIENTFKTKTEEIDQLKETLNNLIAETKVVLEKIETTLSKNNKIPAVQVVYPDIPNTEDDDNNEEIIFN